MSDYLNGDVQQQGAGAASAPTKQLPTGRLQFSKQLDILRAYAAISGPAGKAVTNKEVADVVGMVESTISMNNSFPANIGLLTKTGSGFIPSQDVLNYLHAYEWNQEIAAQKLAPTLRESWFGELLVTRLSFEQMGESEAIHLLAEEVNAAKKYERQVAILIDYLAGSGIVARDNGSLKLGPRAKPGREEQGGATPNPNKASSAQADPPTKPKASSGAQTAFSAPTEGVVQFHISVKVDMGEFKGWEADRIASFFGGIAQVLTAKGKMEEKATAPTDQ